MTFAAILQAVAAIMLALIPSFPVAMVAGALLGLGYGCFLAVDQALATQVLPDAADRGKDLGIMNIASAVPQAVAPLLGAFVVVSLGGFVGLFLLSGLVALLGAATIAPDPIGAMTTKTLTLTRPSRSRRPGATTRPGTGARSTAATADLDTPLGAIDLRRARRERVRHARPRAGHADPGGQQVDPRARRARRRARPARLRGHPGLHAARGAVAGRDRASRMSWSATRRADRAAIARLAADAKSGGARDAS